VPAWLEEKLLAHDPAAVISENAEEAAICGETMNLFITYLATESACLALKLKAMGGIFIGGGILPKILRLVHADHFLKSFRDFGRLKPLLQDVPVKIILNEKAALLGAACYGAFSLKKV
jgi:glucokinase